METKPEIKTHKYSFEDRSAFPFCYIMIGIPFLFFLFFWVYINIDSIFLAFKDSDGNFGFSNFGTVYKAFVDKDMYGWNLSKVLLRSFLLWFFADVVVIVPSLFSSYVLFKKIKGAFVFRIILMIPGVLAGLVWITLMKYMVSLGGPVMTILQKLGVKFSADVLESGLLGSSQTAFLTVLLLLIAPRIISFNLVISGAYARIPQELFEVGRLEGLNFISEFFKIAMPLVWSTFIVLLISNLASIFTVDGGVFLYTMGAHETATMGFYIYYLTYSIAGSADVHTPFYGYPAAIGVTLTCITVPIVLFGKYVLERAVEPVEY